MATFPATTTGNIATTPSAWSTKANGDMEVIASANDSTFGADNNNSGGTTSVDQGYLLNDTPSDFGTMTTLSLQARYGWAAAFTNRTWTVFAARVVKDTGGTILAAADSGGTFQQINSANITSTTPVNSPTQAFSYVNTTATKTDWDDARVEMRITSVRSGGGSSVERRVYAAEVTGTYEIAVATTTAEVGWIEFEIPAAGATDHTKTINDPLGVTDSASTAATTTAEVAWIEFEIPAASGGGSNLTETVNDSLGVTDSLPDVYSDNWGGAVTQGDSLGLADALTVTQTSARSQSDNLGLADSRAPVTTSVRTQTDALGLTDGQTVGGGQSFTRTITIIEAGSLVTT